MMPLSRPEKGKRGESLAVSYLERRGLEVTARNVRSPYGEIDLVARDGATIVFVEVKSRFGAEGSLPQEAVTRAKQRRLTRLAQWYLKRHRLERQSARFDVVAITWQEPEAPQVTWLVNAFDAAR